MLLSSKVNETAACLPSCHFVMVVRRSCDRPHARAVQNTRRTIRIRKRLMPDVVPPHPCGQVAGGALLIRWKLEVERWTFDVDAVSFRRGCGSILDRVA